MHIRYPVTHCVLYPWPLELHGYLCGYWFPGSPARHPTWSYKDHVIGAASVLLTVLSPAPTPCLCPAHNEHSKHSFNDYMNVLYQALCYKKIPTLQNKMTPKI